MKRWIIAAALFVLWSDAAAALACRSAPGTDDYYQYRLVDGKRCWYRGHEKLEKSALAWKSENRPAIGSKPVERLSGADHTGHRARLSGLAAGIGGVGTAWSGVEGSNPSRSTTPDFEETFAHFPAYEVARPVVHLLYPKNVAQAWGAKRVAVVLYRREQ